MSHAVQALNKSTAAEQTLQAQLADAEGKLGAVQGEAQLLHDQLTAAKEENRVIKAAADKNQSYAERTRQQLEDRAKSFELQCTQLQKALELRTSEFMDTEVH